MEFEVRLRSFSCNKNPKHGQSKMVLQMVLQFESSFHENLHFFAPNISLFSVAVCHSDFRSSFDGVGHD